MTFQSQKPKAIDRLQLEFHLTEATKSMLSMICCDKTILAQAFSQTRFLAPIEFRLNPAGFSRRRSGELHLIRM